MKTIHCIGIGGIGVSALARFFLSRGARVSGSDCKDGLWRKPLEDEGVRVFIGHDAENLPLDCDLVIYSSAVPEDNPERREAMCRGIVQKTYAEGLGEAMKEYPVRIAVSGTHGKTTTTALLGLLFEAGGKDPLVIVGGKVPLWVSNFRNGQGDIAVVEACEYERAFDALSPTVAIVNNIEADHLDYYRDISDIENAFGDFVSRLPRNGLLIYNADDERVRKIAFRAQCKKISFNVDGDADIIARKRTIENGGQIFEVWKEGVLLGRVTLCVPGTFNISNALAALSCALAYGVSFPEAKKTLETFLGTWRRFEKVGEVGGKPVISDYAHHPTAARETIAATKEFFPGKKILAVFQPHQRDRTLKLFDEFTSAFDGAEGVILSEIYDVDGRNEAEKEISSRELAGTLQKRNPKQYIAYARDLAETKKMIQEKIGDFDVILIMGAGDIDTIARDVIR
ncbi:MAG: UDP-N-acetylmuramate--L-alanine ligase [Candidatus Lloydbacteria bacterium]|nr:UDP-N-acetylmuramate--L-alanine ligase [Candidatus Lloydbacteria bacterium]